jgi:transcriptional regulator with XRE-family HTH domain
LKKRVIFMNFSFGEQIKIILKRNNMTIQELADLYESQTGSKMTRQNLSQRLRRDNFPEQDMHILAGLLGYRVSVQLTQIAEESILSAPFQSFAAAPPPKPVLHTLPTKQISSSEVTTADGSTLQIPKLFHKEEAPGEINP